MSYSLYIKRLDQPITLEEWTLAVHTTDGARVVLTEMHAAVNPNTGEKIGIRRSPGDTEILDPEEGSWRVAILWRDNRGYGTFNAAAIDRAISGDPTNDHFWQTVSKLAQKCGARVYGEEGEDIMSLLEDPPTG